MPDGSTRQPEDVRALPHNVEAEQAVLGAVMLNNDVWDHVSGRLTPEHFYDPVHGRLWALIGKMIVKGVPATPVLIKAYAVDDEGLRELGGAAYLVNLASITVSSATVRDYAAAIIDSAQRRRIIAAMEDAADRARRFETGTDVGDLILDAESALAAVQREAGSLGHKTVVSSSEAAEAAMLRINAARMGGEHPGIKTGLHALDAMIGGMLDGELLLVAARPSMGKSAVATSIARHVARGGHGVAYWCGEMPPEDVAERMATGLLADRGKRVPGALARQGRIGDDQFRELLLAAQEIEALPISYVESSMRHVDRLGAVIGQIVRRNRAAGRRCIAVVDYLQDVDADGRSLYERSTAAISALKQIAMTQRIPMIVCSQLSRDLERREDKRPQLSDLRDTGKLEEAANTIVFLYREEYYLERARPPEDDPRYPEWLSSIERCRGDLDIIVSKQRSGPIGTVSVRFDGATSRVYEEPKGTADHHARDGEMAF